MIDHPHPFRNALLVFLRAPEKGRVKTRLAKALGDEKALLAYQGFVRDTLENITPAGYTPVLCYHPPDKHQLIAQWLGGSYSYWPQHGTSLGSRMANGFINAFAKGFDQVVLMGTDVPDLPHSHIHDAFAALKTHSAVVGPSKDGGYYLIGFRAQGFLPSVFKNIPWGTGQVLSDTLAIFGKNKASVFLLPPWQDIDDIEDLQDYFQRHPVGKKNTHTMEMITRFSLFSS